MTRNHRLARQIEAVLNIEPAAMAIEFEDRWITWGELRESVVAIDQALTRGGIGPGVPVGVMLRNRPGLIAAVLALLVSQRCIISLSPVQSSGALQEDLRHLKMHAVIGDAMDWRDEGTIEVLRQVGGMGLSIESGRVGPLRRVADFDTAVSRHDGATDTALEMLTSGTTGIPKRIRISNRTLSDAIADGANTASPAGSDAPIILKMTPTIVAAPLMHVSGLFGTLLSICEGRPLVLMEKFAVDAWVDAVARHRVKFTSLPPTPMRMVLDAGVPKEKLASLIGVRAGTAPLPPQTQREFESRYGIPVLVQYGATEWMGGIAGWNLADHKKFGAAKLGSVGRARGDVKLRVVDPGTGQEVLPGEAGVLEVLPTQRLGSTAWTRTTDLAVIDPDGFLYIRGRADDTIIRGGFKVQLNHVSEVLMRHEAVLEASVIGIPDARLGQVPVAAVELRPGFDAIDEGELNAFARKHLAPYQVPVKFKVVAALPRTISMKVSRPGVTALFEEG
ncbi:MAG: long-chain acyl-CoA synthetase [Gammaproteobacteria bacterium]|nr:long-chain acyl-CoA synthetase [Gammaproteobacteria bacterium]